MKISNHLKGGAAGFLAAALFVLGGSASPALAAVTYPDSVLEKAASNNLPDAPDNYGQASVALYNALSTLGVTGTDILSLTGTTDALKIRTRVQEALQVSTFAAVVGPAIKMAVAEFPGAPENIVAYVLSANGYSYSNATGKVADVVKAAIEGMTVAVPEFALGNANNYTGSSNDYSAPDRARVFNIVSKAAEVVAGRIGATNATSDTTRKSREGAIVTAVNAVVKQGLVSGAAVLGVAAVDQAALAGDLAVAAAKAAPDPSNLLSSYDVNARAGLIAAAAIKALPTALQYGNEAVVINKVAAGLVGSTAANRNMFALNALKQVPTASIYNTAVATVALGDTSDAGRVQYAKEMLMGTMGKAAVFRAAAEGYNQVGTAEQRVTAFIAAVAAPVNGVPTQTGFTDAIAAQLAAGAAVANPSAAATAINVAGNLVKATATAAAKNTFRISNISAVVSELAAATGVSAEGYVNSAVNAALTGAVKLTLSGTITDLNLIKLDLAKTLAVSAQNNVSAMKGVVGAIIDSLDNAGSVDRVKLAANMASKVAANAAAVTEIARAAASAGTGLGGPIASGTVFMDSVFAAPSVTLSLTAKMAFAAGLITVKTGEIAAISGSIGNLINIARDAMTTPSQTAANTNTTTFGKNILSAKSESGALLITGSADVAAVAKSLAAYIDKAATDSDRAPAVGAFGSALSQISNGVAKDVVKALLFETNADGAVAWTDLQRGVIASTVVKDLKTNTTTIGQIIDAVTPSLTGADSKSDFLGMLVKKAGATAAIQKCSEKVADSVAAANSGDAKITGLQDWLAKVMGVAGSTGIEKVAAGAAVALKNSGTTAQGVANLFVINPLSNFTTTTALSAKYAQAAVVGVPDAAVEIATTLSRQIISGNSGMSALDRSSIAGNSAGAYGTALNGNVVGAVANTYPSIAVGIASGVIDGCETVANGGQPIKSGTIYRAANASEKAQIIAKVLAGIAPFKFAGVDQYDLLVAYSLRTSATGTAGGAGFTSFDNQALLVSKAAAVAGLLGTDVFTNKVLTAISGTFTSVTGTTGNSMSQFAVKALLGGDGFTAPTGDGIKALLNGFGQNTALSGTLASFAEAVLKQWQTTLPKATTSGTATTYAYTKPSATSLANVAAGLALAAKTLGNDSVIVDIASKISEVSTATFTVPSKVNNKGAVMATTSGTFLADASKPEVASTMAKVNAKQAVGIVEAFAKNMSSSTSLGIMANKVAAVIGATAASGGLVKNTYEEMAAIGSSILLGVEAGTNAALKADYPGLIAEIFGQILKVKKECVYDLTGALLATAKAVGVTDLTSTMAGILAKANVFNPNDQTVNDALKVKANKALAAFKNAIDNFNVGAITTHETAVVNF